MVELLASALLAIFGMAALFFLAQIFDPKTMNWRGKLSGWIFGFAPIILGMISIAIKAFGG